MQKKCEFAYSYWYHNNDQGALSRLLFSNMEQRIYKAAKSQNKVSNKIKQESQKGNTQETYKTNEKGDITANSLSWCP